MDDRSVVEIQIGRRVRSSVVVEARCHLGLPIVIEVPPILDDGTPFPTTHWLSCPLATVRISRLEAAGGVKRADEAIATDEGLRRSWHAAMARYREERDARIPEDWEGPIPSGGIAGSRGGVKCLHAQYADFAAGNANPIGDDVAVQVEPLDCATPCVTGGSDGAEWSDVWAEPPSPARGVDVPDDL